MGRPFVSFKKVTIQKQIPFWVPELKKVIKKRERKRAFFRSFVPSLLMYLIAEYSMIFP
jgi:hypothetical protein